MSARKCKDGRRFTSAYSVNMIKPIGDNVLLSLPVVPDNASASGFVIDERPRPDAICTVIDVGDRVKGLRPGAKVIVNLYGHFPVDGGIITSYEHVICVI